MNKIYNSDSLEFLKTREEFEFDLNYCDPPYALGSEVIIRADGRVDYKNAVDFMNKWDMPTGDYWEEWFKETFRTLKYGGTLIMFGMDRQLLLFKYYAQMAGFIEQQSMYWYYISGFPKASDLSKMIDKNQGNDRKVVGEKKRGNNDFKDNLYAQDKANKNNEKMFGYGIEQLTQSTSNLGQKYDGYKYSIAPLKQTNETIMVFKKPTKTGSILHDAIAYENGDNEIAVSAIDIDGNRVGYDMEDTNPATNPAHRKLGGYKMPEKGVASNGSSDFVSSKNEIKLDGRYPAQTFVDEGAADRLDEQSGTLAGNNSIGGGKGGIWTKGNKQQVSPGFNDTGGASKILHKIQPDLYHYQPKVSNMERNAGLGENFTGGEVVRQGLAGENNNPIYKNNHPTLKPIDLNYKVLNLYKMPNPQKIVYPFSGAGSEIIGGLKAGFDDWVGCELSDEFIEIANARIKYWGDNFKNGYTEIKVDKEKNLAKGQVSLFD